MKRFRFDLESVRDVRIEEERKEAQALAAARREAEAALRLRLDLEAAVGEVRSRIARVRSEGAPVGQLQHMEFVATQLQRQVSHAEEVHRRAEKNVEGQLERYRKAAREREMLDRLRERRLETWRSEQSRFEQKVIDEVALRGRGGAPGGNPEGRWP